jgi:hypothetical protein
LFGAAALCAHWTFSPELSALTVYVIDDATGEKSAQGRTGKAFRDEPSEDRRRAGADHR